MRRRQAVLSSAAVVLAAGGLSGLLKAVAVGVVVVVDVGVVARAGIWSAVRIVIKAVLFVGGGACRFSVVGGRAGLAVEPLLSAGGKCLRSLQGHGVFVFQADAYGVVAILFEGAVLYLAGVMVEVEQLCIVDAVLCTSAGGEIDEKIIDLK